MNVYEEIKHRKIVPVTAVNVEDRWALHEDRPALKPLGKPCHDCAVTCGFYSEISDDLAKEPRDRQQQIAYGWFCHNNRQRACRGNLERLGLLPAEPATSEKPRSA